jgi:hypothetical protein
MPRAARTLTAAPHYVTASTGGRHQVTDRLNGHALSEHANPQAAERAAQLLNTDPAAALAAVRALDDAQTGPAAHVRRTLRRYGYRWALVQSEATDRHSYHELTDLTAAGHLVMVWSTQGLPFYLTPERYQELRDLPTTFQYDTREMIPTAPAAELGRRYERLEAMRDRARYALCELHNVGTGNCPICAPVEDFECDRGGCRANVVTRVSFAGSSRNVCELHAPALAPSLLPARA